MQKINITQEFDAPQAEVFTRICDHEQFGELVGANIKRIKEGDPEANGFGSVRKITPLPGLAFEETVVNYNPPHRMEYVVSKGSPIKNHRGTLTFTEHQGKTRLDYQIEFNPRLPLPLLGSLLKTAIEQPIRKGLKKLAQEYGN